MADGGHDLDGPGGYLGRCELVHQTGNSAVVLYWLGDESPDMENTRAFIARRIDNVMQIEKAKANFKSSPFGRAFEKGPGKILDRIRKPGEGAPDMPGRWRH